MSPKWAVSLLENGSQPERGERLLQETVLQLQQRCGNSAVQRRFALSNGYKNNGRKLASGYSEVSGVPVAGARLNPDRSASGVADIQRRRGRGRSAEDIAEQFRQYGLTQDSIRDFCQEASAEEIINFINETIDSFSDDLLKSQIGDSLRNRADFLIGMTPYLGSFDDVLFHFHNIRTANVPGTVHLHEDAAARIEQVAAALANMRLPMPATTVALGLRGRYRPHTRNSKGLMAHPMGYAIDYRAISNPMITDRRLVALLSLESGGPINFQFTDERGRSLNRRRRRELIQQIGSQLTAGRLEEETREKARRFMEQFESEYERVSEASRQFRESISEDIQNARDLWQTQKQLESQLDRLNNQLRRVRQRRRRGWQEREADLLEQQAELQEQLNRVNETLEGVKEDLSGLFEPWLNQLEEKMRDIEQEVSDIEVVLPTGDEGQETLTGPELLDYSQQELRAVINRVNRLRRGGRRRQGEGLPTPPDLNREFMPKWTWYNQYLKPLDEALRSDPDFVFEGQSSVRNPSVMQLLGRGFFTPDEDAELLAMSPEERPDPESLNPSRHGFNLRFMQVMALFGFDQGISWNPTSLDPMHFELVEGVESIRDAR